MRIRKDARRQRQGALCSPSSPTVPARLPPTCSGGACGRPAHHQLWATRLRRGHRPDAKAATRRWPRVAKRWRPAQDLLPPDPSAFERAFACALEAGADGVLCITLSSGLSRRTPLPTWRRKTRTGHVEVVDSKAVAMEETIEQARHARRGCDARADGRPSARWRTTPSPSSRSTRWKTPHRGRARGQSREASQPARFKLGAFSAWRRRAMGQKAR